MFRFRVLGQAHKQSPQHQNTPPRQRERPKPLSNQHPAFIISNALSNGMILDENLFPKIIKPDSDSQEDNLTQITN